MESLPPVTYYKPAGIPLRELDEVKLTVEEFEALRLKDLEGLTKGLRTGGCGQPFSVFFMLPEKDR